MSERKVRASPKSGTHSSKVGRMPSPSPGVTGRSALPQSSSSGSGTFVRCPPGTLNGFRQLNAAEWITLFTPVVPHPPSTLLAKNMDPFEPLGRALARHVRHVPYRLDNGMTQTHGDFLSSAGAIIIVVCTTGNVIDHNAQAFEHQARFARDVLKKVKESRVLAGVPVLVLLITDGAGRQAHEDGLKDIPALATSNSYSPEALEDTVRLIFGN